MSLFEVVRGWMTTAPTTVTADQEVREVLDLLSVSGGDHACVMDGGRLVGIVSRRDLVRGIARQAARRGGDVRPLLGEAVSEVMTRGLITIGPDATLGEAARLFETHDVHALPVLDGERLVGLLTADNLLRSLTHQVQWV